MHIYKGLRHWLEESDHFGLSESDTESARGTMAMARRGLIEYTETDPWVEWIDAETVHVIVPGFEREELRVQVTSAGKLKVSGQRMLEGSKMSRFEKELRIPNDCDVTGITAKYEDETLQIWLPKSTALPKDDMHSHEPQPQLHTQHQVPEKHQPQTQPQPHTQHQVPEKHQPQTQPQPHPQHQVPEKHAGKGLREAEVAKSERIGGDGRSGGAGRAGMELERRKSRVVMVLVVIGAMVVGYLSGRLDQAVRDGWKIVMDHS